MRHTVKQAKPIPPITFPLKKVIPAVLLSSLALPMAAPAQESPAPSTSEDQAWDELFGQLSADEPKDEAAAPTSAPGPAAAEPAVSGDDLTIQEVPPPPAPGAAQHTETASEQDQPPAPSDAQAEMPELDVIPLATNTEPAPRVAEAPKGREIEEVVVTAQKREQVSQEVPISMTVLSETFIKDQGITNVQDALLFVPNFRVVELLGRISPQCRGFTVSDSNPAFEAPCGLAVDGLAFSRGSYFSAGLMDLKRMEVLRGPQGTTFGKNTTAGVVSLVTKDPTDEFTANADLQYGLSGQGVQRAEVGVGGPLIPDVVNFRLVGVSEQKDPFAENTYHQTQPEFSEDAGDSDRTAYRAKLAFPNIFGAQLKLMHEYTDLFSNGIPAKFIPLENGQQGGYIRQYDPNADFGENYKVSNRGNKVWTETTRNQAELNFDWADWSFTGVGGFGELTNRQELWVVPAPYPFAFSKRGEENPYTTGELRAVSPDFDGLLGLDNLFGLDLGSSNMLIGVFAQRNELGLSIDSDFYYEGLVTILLAAQNAPTVPAGTLLRLLGLPNIPGAKESFFIRFNQQSDSTAIFSQLTWNMTEKWSLDFGGRLSEEKKEGHWDVSYSNPAPLFNTPPADRSYTKDKTLDSASFQPKVSVSYKLNDDINLFAHWARAYKSGGFNAYTSTGDPEQPNQTNPNATIGSLTYDDETGTDWGFDMKMRLFDNTMQLNLSLFRLTVDDFQVLTEVRGTEVPTQNIFLPNGYQQVVNAGKARAQGAELDATWLATEWLTVIAAVGYNDTEYLSFPLDNCDPGEDADPDTGKCDHTGKPFKGTPKLTGTLSLDSRFPLGGLWSALGDTNFLLGGTAEYTGTRFEGDYNPESKQDAQYLFRAHTGLANASQGWSFRLTMLNLTNEYAASESIDLNRTQKTIGLRPPRSVFAQFSWNY